MLNILQINANTIVLHDFTDSQGSEQLVESLAPHLRRKYLMDLSLIGKDFRFWKNQIPLVRGK